MPKDEKKDRDQEPRQKPGPEPERLKIEGDWKEAIKKALEAGEPPASERPKDAE